MRFLTRTKFVVLSGEKVAFFESIHFHSMYLPTVPFSFTYFVVIRFNFFPLNGYPRGKKSYTISITRSSALREVSNRD